MRDFARPEWLFFLVALVAGLILCALIPPLGGGNETYHFQRAVSVAYGYLRVREAWVPAGFVEFLAQGDRFFSENLQPPFSYSVQEYHRMAAIALQPGRLVAMEPNAIVIQNPLAYLPQALAIRLGALFSLSPLTLFYMGRLAGMLTAVSLVFLAIRRMPSQGYAMCAMALLPSIAFSRSTLDADQMMNALGFLFIATMARETTREETLTTRDIVFLMILAFWTSLCKSVYLPLMLLVFAIPRRRFASGLQHKMTLASILVPGPIISLCWMSLVNADYYSTADYVTWAGHVQPHRQMQLILYEPIRYAGVLLKTIFATPMLPRAFAETIGQFGPPVALPFWNMVVMLELLIAIALLDPTPQPAYPTRRIALISGVIFPAFIVLMLTTQYMIWTGYGADVIKGFQGRYLGPWLPLSLLLVKPLKQSRRYAILCLAGFALFAVGGMLIIAHNTYY